MDYIINAINDMQNEKDFFYHCNVSEYIRDFVEVFEKLTMDYWNTKF